ncbi:DUF5686 family protein [Mesonia maritima]|uniref:DUF5686 family protein n=1 Tax=Mesonia maritima TaxID=1793873 RepID=UPI00362F8954
MLFGYHWADSYHGLSFDISAPVMGVQYNTVQGWNLTLDTYFRKEQEENEKYWELFSSMNYGLADDRYRMTGGFRKKFNNNSRPYFTIEGGIEAKQINDTEPIRPIVNSVATLFFDKNYLKLYDRTFVEASYSEELFNGFRLYTSASFERRNPLFNDAEIIEDEEAFTSNNPLEPRNFSSAPFQEHNIAKLSVTGRINFDQKYYNYPDGKYNVSNSDYPTLYASYEKGFASTIEEYNFDHVTLTAIQDLDLQNKGNFSYMLKGGAFFNAEEMAFVDYKHFNGNLTHVKLSDQIYQFNLLPYYSASTNEEYGELHVEHNFQGWILGKIPFINKLNFNMVAGVNALWTTGNKPYSEYSVGMSNIGFGKFRFLRIDYVRAYQGTWQDDGVMFGISIGL